jgi:hypothetical protein
MATEGTIQLEHNGSTYRARWIHDDSDVLSVWPGEFGPISTIVGSRTADGRPCRHIQPEMLARQMLQEFLEARDAAGQKASNS